MNRFIRVFPTPKQPYLEVMMISWERLITADLLPCYYSISWLPLIESTMEFCYIVLNSALVYALLTYGNMPVQPRLRVKFFLKFKYENIVWLAFQKNLYSKTRLDGHITIREKSVLRQCPSSHARKTLCTQGTSNNALSSKSW